MSPLPVTAASVNAERTGALARLGYSEPEASFLALAALHGGYFLRRQVAQFLGRKDGGVVTGLVQKTLDFAHAQSSAQRQGALLYHLCSRPFYEALGEPDNRNRRRHEVADIKNRIMRLDFVLGHPEAHYLATERERLAYFESLHIDRGLLPQKAFRARLSGASTARFFVDKYPFFLAPASTERASLPTFTFVDEGLVTLSRFERHLTEYGSLLCALGQFAFIYVASVERHFAGARALFARVAAGNGGSISSSDLNAAALTNVRSTDRLRTYFELRKRFEDRNFTSFDREQLLRLRDEKDAFASAETEQLYHAWRSSGQIESGSGWHTNGRAQSCSDVTSRRPFSASFSTAILNHDYSLFDYFVAS